MTIEDLTGPNVQIIFPNKTTRSIAGTSTASHKRTGLHSTFRFLSLTDSHSELGIFQHIRTILKCSVKKIIATRFYFYSYLIEFISTWTSLLNIFVTPKNKNICNIKKNISLLLKILTDSNNIYCWRCDFSPTSAAWGRCRHACPRVGTM